MGALALAWVAAALPHAAAQTPPQPLARDLHEAVQRIAVTAREPGGRQVAGEIALTLYRPDGDGPFPLALVSHGRSAPEQRRTMGRSRFEPLARYLVSKGFAVIVPTRLGYGDTFGLADPENTGGCTTMRVDVNADAAAEQALAAVAYARTLPWIDPSRWIAIGQSVGGIATLEIAARRPPGLVGAINFAGGSGGNPDRRAGTPCMPQQLEQLWRQRSASAGDLPTLWLYWQNDLYWGPEIPRRWAQAWAEGGGRIDFHHLAPAGKDGHGGVGIDMDHWVPIAEQWLAALGFTRSGLVPRPPASGHARVDEADKVPVGDAVRQGLYRRFLQSAPPRAFAIGPNGAAGWAHGDWARGRALGYCQRTRGERCTLYAVDDDVVWVASETPAK